MLLAILIYFTLIRSDDKTKTTTAVVTGKR